MKVKPLTKSRFKMALECPTKLYYSAHDEKYFDKNDGNDFLQALADGGIQVGELAKFKYHDDPISAKITIDTLVYDEAIAQTNARLAESGKVVIAEAALRHEDLFVRVDILILHPQSKVMELIEVKSKSVKQEVLDSGFQKDRTKWLPYLYDIAFQTEVAKKVFPDYKIVPKLLLLNPEKMTDINGLHQHFKIVYKEVPGSKDKRPFIETLPNLKREQLGGLNVLLEVDVTDVVDNLRASEVDCPHALQEATQDLPTFITWASKVQKEGTRYFGTISKECKSCQFRADASQEKLSGLHECWAEKFHLNGELDRKKPLSIDIWGGGSGSVSMAQKALDKNRVFLADIQPDDIRPGSGKEEADVGMSAFERRLAQIEAAKSPNDLDNAILLAEDRLEAMDGWAWPLHMIDFETSAPAIPFFKGMHPYETLAFQFSHHIMENDASGKVYIRHANQWISTAADTFPSIEFVRALKKALMPDGELKGTVFRYHNHENTVLRKLREVIKRTNPGDAEELIAFIDLITVVKENGRVIHKGSKNMVDLHRLVQEGYYSKHAGGSISLKYMLPAILHDAPNMKALYSDEDIYGKDKKIKSLNFDVHRWLDSRKENDPYKTLPAIFGKEYGELNEMLLRLAGNDGDDDEGGAINQGGLAMTAYNYTQFSCLNDKERKAIEEALLRYCELDTLAMVMLVQGLMELRGKSLELAN